jgi:hypothetical protein
VIRTPLPPLVTSAIKATKRRAALVGALRALWPPLMVLAGVGAFGSVAAGLPAFVVSAIAGMTTVCVAWLFYRAIDGFHPLNDAGAQRSIEAANQKSELAPLTSFGDRPISGDTALWAWHQARLDGEAKTLSRPINPKLTRLDIWKAIALTMAVCACVWQPVAAARILSFDLSPLMGDGDLVVDVWAVPPDYTGLPVVRLDRGQRDISLPAGSVVYARMDGARGAPVLRVGGRSVQMSRASGQAWSANATFDRSGNISIGRLGPRASWQAKAIKDHAPILSSFTPIKIDPKGRLDVAFSATDDYGIQNAALRIKAINPPQSMARKPIVETPLNLDPASGAAEGDGGTRRLFVDVTQHVLTGLDVEVRLVLRDGLGQETLSEPTRLVMPEVKWTTPLGAALQEQRLLILRETRPYRSNPPALATLFDPASGEPVKLDLSEGLMGAPDNILRAERLLRATLSSLRETGLSDLGVMGMGFALERLALARDLSGAQDVAPILWDLAIQAEQADKTPAQQRLAAARNALEEALKNGASDSDIRDLSQDLRDAVKERLNELAQQGEGQGGQSGGQGGGSISDEEIGRMLSELEQSGTSGARQDALDQLAQLGEMLDNLQSGGSQTGEQGTQQSDGSGQSNGANPLDEAMRTQRDLTDDTTQRRNEGNGGPTPDLAQRQEDLADQLAAPGSAPARPDSPEGQVEAGKQQAAQAMREAARALREGDLDRAQQAQSQAEQALQQAAQAQGANQAGGDGDQDPLGRRLTGPDDGRGTKVPNQSEKRRARDIREELRRRQADPNRDDQERGYIDRLLKD